jgi:hypothetical protein
VSLKGTSCQLYNDREVTQPTSNCWQSGQRTLVSRAHLLRLPVRVCSWTKCKSFWRALRRPNRTREQVLHGVGKYRKSHVFLCFLLSCGHPTTKGDTTPTRRVQRFANVSGWCCGDASSGLESLGDYKKNHEAKIIPPFSHLGMVKDLTLKSARYSFRRSTLATPEYSRRWEYRQCR